MATARQWVQRLAEGDANLSEVVDEFESRAWPKGAPVLTEGQAAGVDDVPLASDNSPDWIELQAGLSEAERDALREAYDRAVGGVR